MERGKERGREGRREERSQKLNLGSVETEWKISDRSTQKRTRGSAHGT